MEDKRIVIKQPEHCYVVLTSVTHDTAHWTQNIMRNHRPHWQPKLLDNIVDDTI